MNQVGFLKIRCHLGKYLAVTDSYIDGKAKGLTDAVFYDGGSSLR